MKKQEIESETEIQESEPEKQDTKSEPEILETEQEKQESDIKNEDELPQIEEGSGEPPAEPSGQGLKMLFYLIKSFAIKIF